MFKLEPQSSSARHEPAAVAQVAVLIVSYNGRDDVCECLESVFACQDESVDCRVTLLDNGSTDGTVAAVRRRFPEVDIIASDENLAFAGGNNLGWQTIAGRWPDVEFLFLLNQDTVVTPGWLSAAVQTLRDHPNAACAQAKLLLHDEPQRLNTAGNVSHFLGFGFTTGYGEIDRGQFDERLTMDFPSGAAVIVRADTLRRLGLFDDEFFMYLEDADLGWNIRQAGLEICFAPACRVYHKYTFKSPRCYYYYLERNRWLLLLTYYKAPTLLLLTPALALMEVGQMLFALRQGVLRQRLAAYGYFLRPGRLARLWRRRRAAQRRRCVNDWRFLASHQGAIEFGPIRGPLVRYVANPLLGAYWRVVKLLIWW